MRVIIAGSRSMSFRHYDLIAEGVKQSGFCVDEVVCGEAEGADTFGKKWAFSNNIPVTSFPPKWKEFGKYAGFKRNGEMANYADALIAFIFSNSAGSINMVRQMQELDKPTFAIYDGRIGEAF